MYGTFVEAYGSMAHKEKVLFFKESHEIPRKEVAPTLNPFIQNDIEATLDERFNLQFNGTGVMLDTIGKCVVDAQQVECPMREEKQYGYPCQASESHTHTETGDGPNFRSKTSGKKESEHHRQ